MFIKLFQIFLIAVAFDYSNLYAGFLNELEISQATTLAKNQSQFEEITQVISDEGKVNREDWLSLEDFEFLYKNKTNKFVIANSFNSSTRWGEVAIYAGDTNLSKIKVVCSGSFSDIGKAAPYLATLNYEYIPVLESQESHFIIEHVTAGYEAGGKGYSQALLGYFMDEFVTKHTKVNYVFSDLRARATKHYFPKHGFQNGELSGFKFSRGMQYPFYWLKKIG